MNKFALSLAAAFGSFLAASAQAQETRLTIGTAGTGGALYPMGVAMAETINRHLENIQASAEASGGSLENLRNLSTGELDWGISANEVAYQAYHGEGSYEGRPIERLRSLFGTVVSWTQIFAAADSELDSVADFAGRRIGVGPAGSAGEQTAQRLLNHFGLSYDDVDEQYMSDGDMATALQDGMLDAFITTHPLRSAPLMDLTTSFDVKVIPVEDEAFYAENPYFTATEIPANTYEGVEEGVLTPTSRIVMYTTVDAPFSDEQVYELLSSIWNNGSEWQDVHAAVKNSTTLQAALVGLEGVPLHPGAVRFYQDQGNEISDALR
jgi:TRAP transporter TAXI family solute receptor